MLHSPIKPLAISVLLHGALALVLLTWRFSESPPAVIGSLRAVDLIAPRLTTPQAPEPTSRALPAQPVRRFRAPDALRRSPAPQVSIVIPEGPILSIAAPPLLAPEVPRTPFAPLPPPLKTDNLASVQAAPTSTGPLRIAKPAGFGSLETSAPHSTHAGISSSTAFDSTAIAAPAAPLQIARAGAFGDAAFATPASVTRKIAAGSGSSPVEILFKPRPAYTDDARSLQLQGEVLLEVLFAASGEASVLRVTRSLGHGLDECAIAAASAIRFRPAQRDGAPADSTAVVHIVFELAY